MHVICSCHASVMTQRIDNYTAHFLANRGYDNLISEDMVTNKVSSGCIFSQKKPPGFV